MLGRQQTYDASAEQMPPPVLVPKYTRQKTENYHASYATENEGVYSIPIDWCEARMYYVVRNHVQFSPRRLLYLLPWRWCEWRQKVITQASKPKQPRHQSRNAVSTQIITEAQSQVNISELPFGWWCVSHALATIFWRLSVYFCELQYDVYLSHNSSTRMTWYKTQGNLLVHHQNLRSTTLSAMASLHWARRTVAVLSTLLSQQLLSRFSGVPYCLQFSLWS